MKRPPASLWNSRLLLQPRWLTVPPLQDSVWLQGLCEASPAQKSLPPPAFKAQFRHHLLQEASHFPHPFSKPGERPPVGSLSLLGFLR